MNNPIRCTPHFHTSDNRKREIEQLRKENELLKTWVKHHQASAENALKKKDELQKENERLKESLTQRSTLGVFK